MAQQPNILEILKQRLDPVRQEGSRMYSQFREAARKNDSAVANILRDFHAFVSSSKKEDSNIENQIDQLDNKISNLSKKTDNLSDQLNELVKQQQEFGIKLQKIIKILDINLIDEKVGKGFLSHLKTLFEDKKSGNANLLAAGLGAAVIGAQGLSNIIGGGRENAQSPSTPGAGQSSQSGDQIEQILSTIRQKESSGNYKAKNPNSSASGAYQFIDGTWQSLTKKYNIGTEYKTAGDAPKEVQDQVARKYVEQILKENNNDVSKVPLVWFTGNPQGKMSEAALKANRGQTGEAYQSRWMEAFNKMGGGSSQSTGGGGNQQPQSQQQNTETMVPSFGASTPQRNPSESSLRTQQGINLSNVDEKLLNLIKQIQSSIGKELVISSARRSKDTPGVSGPDPHQKGMAVDISYGSSGLTQNSDTTKSIVQQALASGITGIGLEGNHLHLDISHDSKTLWGSDFKFGSAPDWAKSLTNWSNGERGSGQGQTQEAASNTPQQQTPIQTPRPRITEREAVNRAFEAAAASQETPTQQNFQNMQRPTAMFSPTPSGIGSNLITNILNSVMGNRLPSNMIRDTRPTQIQNAAINSLIQPANRNDFVRNVNQQPNLDPNNQQSNAWVNEKQSGMDARLSSFLQVNESNWGSRLASYYGLQQESGMAYNATG